MITTPFIITACLAIFTLAHPLDDTSLSQESSKVNVPSFSINAITYGGIACPQGSVTIDYTPDRTSFSVIYESIAFTIYSGPEASVMDRRKNCQLTIDVAAPSGWQYAIQYIKSNGTAYLEGEGMVAEYKNTVYFQGETRQTSVTKRFQGPISALEDYVAEERMELLWSPCGVSRPVNVNTQMRYVKEGQGEERGFVTVDAMLGWSLVWRAC